MHVPTDFFQYLQNTHRVKERSRIDFLPENLLQHAGYEESSSKTRALYSAGRALWFDTDTYKIKLASKRWEDFKDEFCSSSNSVDGSGL